LKKYYFNFEECKATLNIDDLIVKPVYKYGGRKNDRKAKRNFSVILSEEKV